MQFIQSVRSRMDIWLLQGVIPQVGPSKKVDLEINSIAILYLNNL
jgi:hypothetical protein